MIYPDFTNPGWLRNAMDGAGIRIYQLAAASGVSRDQIERIRHDGRSTKIGTAIKLADAIKQLGNKGE